MEHVIVTHNGVIACDCNSWGGGVLDLLRFLVGLSPRSTAASSMNKPGFAVLVLCSWMNSVRNVLGEKPQFVDTGEQLPGKGGHPQKVWRLDKQDGAAGEQGQQQRSKKAHPPPFLGVHGNPNG